MSSNEPITSPETLSLPHFNEEADVTFSAPRGSTSRGQGRNTVKTPLDFCLDDCGGRHGRRHRSVPIPNAGRTIRPTSHKVLRTLGSDLSQPNESGSLSDPKGELQVLSL